VAVDSAARTVLDEVAECDGVGGMVAVDAGGNVGLPFSTDAMPRGVWRPGRGPVVDLP
jgi:isoaspartyl peptidase/L-asparaginase-like protein (Ntn-hydrolase superfamily)